MELIRREHTHFHPSGEVSVSKEDISTTKRLFKAGRLIGIELLDHIIIGRKENGDSYGYAYYNMKEQGWSYVKI